MHAVHKCDFILQHWAFYSFSPRTSAILANDGRISAFSSHDRIVMPHSSSDSPNGAVSGGRAGRLPLRTCVRTWDSKRSSLYGFLPENTFDECDLVAQLAGSTPNTYLPCEDCKCIYIARKRRLRTILLTGQQLGRHPAVGPSA